MEMEDANIMDLVLIRMKKEFDLIFEVVSVKGTFPNGQGFGNGNGSGSYKSGYKLKGFWIGFGKCNGHEYDGKGLGDTTLNVNGIGREDIIKL